MVCLRSVGISALVLGLGCSANGSMTDPITVTQGDSGTPTEDGASSAEDTDAPAEDTDVGAADARVPVADTGAIADTGATTADTAPPLDYPTGPYGKKVGSVIANLRWDGYRDGTGAWTTISLLDYYDPDGSRGIRAIKIAAAALWCGVCKGEAGPMTKTYPGQKARGARYITALFQDASHAASSKASVDSWVSTYKCNYDVVNDPSKTVFGGISGTLTLPYNVIVDPRTMKIVGIIQGGGPDVDTAVDALLKTNGG
jgi:hypothetical protein